VTGDVAGLLGNLRRADALLAVTDAFSPGADPVRDLEQLRLELLVADSEHVEKRLERVRIQAKSGDPALRQEAAQLEALHAHVQAGGTIADFSAPVSEALE